jgi:hypothetical protein
MAFNRDDKDIELLSPVSLTTLPLEVALLRVDDKQRR